MIVRKLAIAALAVTAVTLSSGCAAGSPVVPGAAESQPTAVAPSTITPTPPFTSESHSATQDRPGRRW